MKFLFPRVTVLMTVHMKTDTLEEAIQSVLHQTRQDFQFLILDSGLWIGRDDERAMKMASIHDRYANRPRIEWVFTGEHPDDWKTTCMVSKVTNMAIVNRLVRGKYVSTFYDDDIYYPEFIEKMAGYLDAHPEADAVRCSEERAEILPDGQYRKTGALMAREDITGENYDCRVDGMQVMLKMAVFDRIEYPYLPEEADQCSHSDGVFLNKVGRVIDRMHFVEDILCEHRATPVSTFTPTQEKSRLE